MGFMDEIKKIIHPYDDEDYDYEEDFEEFGRDMEESERAVKYLADAGYPDETIQNLFCNSLMKVVKTCIM